MNEKHTPGPWIDQHWDGNQQITINATAFRGPNVLALVRPPLTARYDERGDLETYDCTPQDVAEAGANARLIAAAPELLAALEELLPYAEKRIAELTDKMTGSLYPAINQAKLNRARAAIAKATT